MRCIVTGGAGFIGKHLVKALRDRGDEVSVWDIADTRFINVTDLWEIRKQVREFQPEVIYHLAAVSRTPVAIANPFECHETNVSGTLSILEMLRQMDPIIRPRLVFASSNIVYGNRNIYKASKHAAEEYIRTYREQHGVKAAILRYFNVYGPGMLWDDPICLAAMRKSAVERGYVEIHGDGTQIRNFVHVTDVVRATITLGNSGFNSTVDIRCEEQHTMNEAASYFAAPIRYTARREGDSDVLLGKANRYWLVNPIPFHEGMKDVVSDIPPLVKRFVEQNFGEAHV